MTIFSGNRPLLDAFRQGHREALSSVYRAYVDEVATLIRRGFTVDAARVSVPGVAEPQRQRDLIQDVFVRAFDERARLAYDGVSPFRPWLMRIAKNAVIDEWRKTGRLIALEDAAASKTVSELDAVLPVSPEEEFTWEALRKATRAFCATLEPPLPRFVQLRFEEENSQADVAKALGVSRRQIRTWEEVVRRRLRRHLAALGLP